MISERNKKFFLNRYVGCFGNFRKNDPICGKHCAINLRCAIEYERNERFEILEDLVYADGIMVKMN